MPSPLFLTEDEVARKCLKALTLSLGRQGNCLCHDTLPPTALNLSDDAVIVVDARQRIVYFNDRAGELAGVLPENALGRNCKEALGCVNCRTSCMLFEQGEICARDVEIERPDGHRRRLVKNGRLLHDSSGAIVGGIETLRDVTDLHTHGQEMNREAERLRARCQFLETFTDQLDEGVAAIDMGMKLVCLTTRAAELLGVDRENAVGADLRELVQDAQRLEQPLTSAFEGGRADVANVVAKAGERRLHLRLRPLMSERAGVMGATLVVALEPEPIESDETSFFGMVGRAPVMRRLYRNIQALARGNATALILGESGSGKELVARALHLAGPRPTRPFHAVNCASLSEPLLESELFGHERGSFTGAHRSKQGRMEVCGDGSLLLDEVGCLPLGIQAKLLRVLETREFERVGSTQTKRLEARIVAATNSDLERMVREGTFRPDLYYRLKVVPIEVPPLRERTGDVLLLAAHFVQRIAQSHGRSDSPRLTSAACAALEAHRWPGNVRELLNAIEFAMSQRGSGAIDLDDLPPEVRSVAPGTQADERARIEDALQRAHYNRARAAESLQMSRVTLWRRMRALGLESPESAGRRSKPPRA